MSGKCKTNERVSSRETQLGNKEKEQENKQQQKHGQVDQARLDVLSGAVADLGFANPRVEKLNITIG